MQVLHRPYSLYSWPDLACILFGKSIKLALSYNLAPFYFANFNFNFVIWHDQAKTSGTSSSIPPPDPALPIFIDG